MHMTYRDPLQFLDSRLQDLERDIESIVPSALICPTKDDFFLRK